jgi:hypothetical protein
MAKWIGSSFLEVAIWSTKGKVFPARHERFLLPASAERRRQSNSSGLTAEGVGTGEPRAAPGERDPAQASA